MRELTADEHETVTLLLQLRPYVGPPSSKLYGALAVALLPQRSQRQVAELLDVPREWLR